MAKRKGLSSKNHSQIDQKRCKNSETLDHKTESNDPHKDEKDILEEKVDQTQNSTQFDEKEKKKENNKEEETEEINKKDKVKINYKFYIFNYRICLLGPTI